MSITSVPTSEDELVINALSFETQDGGSIASLISLITIVEEIMNRVQSDRKLQEAPLPSQHFKFIIGAGFASLLAVMFGRLGLSVDAARRHCMKFTEDVFSKRKLYGQGKFKARKLKAALERMLQACGEDRDARMLSNPASNPHDCKVIVFAASEHAQRAESAVSFRSYPFDRNYVPDCTIVEAICAAFSLPGVFKPGVIIEPGPISVSYVGFCDFNPTARLLEELPLVFPSGQLNCVVNIGDKYKNSNGTNEGIAEALRARFSNIPGGYFRFYVQHGVQDIGISEWKKRLEARALGHARSYLHLMENSNKVDELVKALNSNTCLIPAARARGAIQVNAISNPIIKPCPPPSGLFAGRQRELAQMEKALLGHAKGRRVFVLYGPGGAGKTQLALQFVEIHKEKYTHIFYIDASSAATIEADLKSIALGKKAGDDPKDALTWMAQNAADSLLIYNNADDTQLDLSQFLPACSQGGILVTTRNRRVTVLATGSESQLHIREMLKGDARKLLSTTSGVPEGLDSAVEDLLEELGHFALAIVQAGAFIHTHPCTVSEYLEMYRDSRGQLLEDYAQHLPKLDDYRLTVYATWRVSYVRIAPPDQRLYDVLAFMHHEHISKEIFQLAALGIEQHKSTLPLSEEERGIEQGLSTMLARFQDNDGKWNKAAFLKFIDELLAYSFITVDPANQSYSIHRLVQQWIRSEVKDSETVRSRTALLLASCVMPDYKSKDYAFRSMLLNHFDALPMQDKGNPQVAGRAKTVYYEAGRYKEAEQLVKYELEAKTHRLGGEVFSTLRCKAWLASILSKQGQWDDAEILQREVIAVIERVGGQNHPYTLTTKASLADTLRSQGRWAEAEALGREVVESSRQVLGAEHSDTTTRMGNLACTLWKQRKWREAEALDREVIEIKKRLHGNDHHDTQTSIANLATALWSQGQLQEARRLHEEVLEVSKRTRGRDHPYTLKCMNNLASTYWKLNMWQEGEELQREAVEITRKVQGDEHPQTIKSMANLAEMHRRQKRWKEAESLEQEVVKMRSRKLGDSHPDTIKSLANLALTYQGLGRLSEAEGLMERAANASKHVLGDVHPYTVSRINWLNAIRGTARTESKGTPS